MNKRLTTAFTIFSVVVFAFLIVWFVFRTINTRSENLLAAREELESIAKTVSSSYLTAGSFNSSYFTERVMNSISGNETLKALVVSTGPKKAEFAYAVSNRYFPEDVDFDGDVSIPFSFSYNAIAEEAISTSAIMPSGNDILLEAVYGIFERSEVFPIVRELLIGLLSFLLVTAVLIILHPFIASKLEKAVLMQPAAEAAPAGQAPATQPAADATPYSRTAATEDVDVTEPAEAAESKSAPRSDTPAAPAITTRVPETKTGGLYSPTTELVWEKHLEDRLSAELKRAASFDQDLVLLLASVIGLSRAETFYAELSQTAREFFNFQDLCFEYGGGGIGIIIPNVDIDEGIERVEVFKNRVDRRLGEARFATKLTAGLSARNGRLISGNRIIREARSALRRAQQESAEIVAFRVDPEKYREYIARKSSKQR